MTVGASGLAAIVAGVQRLPYAWPGPPTAMSAGKTGQGTCAAKPALLREDLEAVDLVCAPLMVVGPLAPGVWPDLHEVGSDLLEVHECLTVVTPWAGPLLVDVTWHPAAVQAGLPGTLAWDGSRDMTCAVKPLTAYAVDSDFRAQKEKLRSRLYATDRRERRDRLLAEIARRASELR